MATVHTPVKGYTGTVVGVDFKDGVAETESVHALGYFERQGYKITWPEPEVPTGAPSSKWTKDALVAFADEHKIDLGEANTKAEILAVFESGKEANPPSDDGTPTTEDNSSK